MPNFTLTFNDDSFQRFNRYWLMTCVRAARYGGAYVDQALAAIDRVPAGVTKAGAGGSEGSGLGGWFSARIGDGKALVVLAGDGAVPIGWWGGFIAATQGPVAGVPGRVNASWNALAGGVAGAVPVPPVTGSQKPAFYVCGHGATGAVAQLVAFKLAQTNPGALTQIIGFGAPVVGNAAYVAAFGNATAVFPQNPFDPIPQAVGATVNFLSGGVGSNTTAVALYSQPPGREVWPDGLGFPFVRQALPGGSTFLGIPLTPFSRRTRYADLDAATQISQNTPAVWSHLTYYYTLKYYSDTISNSPTSNLRRADGFKAGFDVLALDALNGSLNVQDGYSLDPVFPAATAPGP